MLQIYPQGKWKYGIAPCVLSPLGVLQELREKSLYHLTYQQKILLFQILFN